MSIIDQFTDDDLLALAGAFEAIEQGARPSDLEATQRHALRTLATWAAAMQEGAAQ